MNALTFAFVIVATAIASYILGYHVRGEVQQSHQEPERRKKSYEMKAEKYFGSGVK